MGSELPLPYPIGYSNGGWVVGTPFYLHGLLPVQLNNNLTMHIGTLRLIDLANSRLWLVLSYALDPSKKAENTGVSLLT